MSEESAKSLCFECKRPLVEIDNRGQRLHDVQHLVVAHGWRGGQAVSEGLGCAACNSTVCEIVAPNEEARTGGAGLLGFQWGESLRGNLW